MSINKTIVVITISSLLSITVNSQDTNRFDYKLLKSGRAYSVTPVFDQFKGEGKKGYASWPNDYCFNNLFNNIIKEVLSKEKLDSLHPRSFAVITVNSKGEIPYCHFVIYDKEKNAISERDLYNLYIRFKQIKLDMSKVKILGYYAEESYDYADIMLPLILKNCKEDSK